MLKQDSYTKKIKKENPSNVFQYGYSRLPSLIPYDGGQVYKTVAESTEGNFTSPKKLFQGGFCMSHGELIQNVPSAATDNEGGMASNGFSNNMAVQKNILKVFPLEVLSPVKKSIFFVNKFYNINLIKKAAS